MTEDFDDLTADHAILRDTRVLLVGPGDSGRADLLAAAGMRVDVAADGAAALAMAAKGNYEIAVIDLDGAAIATAERLRARSGLADLVILAIAPDAADDRHGEALAAGIDDILALPFTTDRLYSVIQKWVTGLGEAAQLPPGVRESMLGRGLHFPSRIEGLDLRAGLRRVAGLRALYLRSLRGFVEQQADIANRLRRSVAEGDLPVAAREAHTFKGLAGMIDAAEPRALALAIERALAVADIDTCQALLDRLENILVPLCEAIRAAVDGGAKETSSGENIHGAQD